MLIAPAGSGSACVVPPTSPCILAEIIIVVRPDRALRLLLPAALLLLPLLLPSLARSPCHIESNVSKVVQSLPTVIYNKFAREQTIQWGSSPPSALVTSALAPRSHPPPLLAEVGPYSAQNKPKRACITSVLKPPFSFRCDNFFMSEGREQEPAQQPLRASVR